MRYNQYYPIDVLNGPGTRCTLFVSGCEHQCRGCYNQSTWSLDSGVPFTQELSDRIIADLQDTRIKRRGLSLSGGDPLHPANLADVLALVKRVRTECPGKDIWCWTGYTLETLTPEQQEVVDQVDALIDGKFVEELKDPSLVWHGSSNQRVHKFNRTPASQDYRWFPVDFISRISTGDLEKAVREFKARLPAFGEYRPSLQRDLAIVGDANAICRRCSEVQQSVDRSVSIKDVKIETDGTVTALVRHPKIRAEGEFKLIPRLFGTRVTPTELTDITFVTIDYDFVQKDQTNQEGNQQ